jgi:hypothetical protein
VFRCEGDLGRRCFLIITAAVTLRQCICVRYAFHALQAEYAKVSDLAGAMYTNTQPSEPPKPPRRSLFP